MLQRLVSVAALVLCAAYFGSADDAAEGRTSYTYGDIKCAVCSLAIKAAWADAEHLRAQCAAVDRLRAHQLRHSGLHGSGVHPAAEAVASIPAIPPTCTYGNPAAAAVHHITAQTCKTLPQRLLVRHEAAEPEGPRRRFHARTASAHGRAPALLFNRSSPPAVPDDSALAAFAPSVEEHYGHTSLADLHCDDHTEHSAHAAARKDREGGGPSVLGSLLGSQGSAPTAVPKEHWRQVKLACVRALHVPHGTPEDFGHFLEDTVAVGKHGPGAEEALQQRLCGHVCGIDRLVRTRHSMRDPPRDEL